MKYESLSLDDLFMLAKKGDVTAFEQIVINTEKALFNLALSYLRSREDAEDATQEIYLRLWRKIPDYRGGGAKVYLFKTARNICIDMLRHAASATQPDSLSLESEGERYERDIEDSDSFSQPDKAYLRKVKKEALKKCINRLPDHSRELIVLRDVQGLSYAEIGELLSIPEGTVKSRLSRARERLKELLLEEKDLF